MIGIVLAGGESRRFGSPKAFATYKNRLFYEYAIDALTPHCTEVIVVARPEHMDCFPETIQVMTDRPEIRGQGPLAGILTVMAALKSEWYAVLPCDVPFVNDSIVAALKSHRDGCRSIALEEADTQHPLLSIWSEEAEPMIRSALETGKRSVHPLVERWIDGEALLRLNPSLFDNVNRPGQLEGR